MNHNPFKQAIDALAQARSMISVDRESCPPCDWHRWDYYDSAIKSLSAAYPTVPGELPPLPEPDFSSGDMTIGETAYTAEQMQAYASQAVALAAASDLHSALRARIAHHQRKLADDNDQNCACSSMIVGELKIILAAGGAMTAPVSPDAWGLEWPDGRITAGESGSRLPLGQAAIAEGIRQIPLYKAVGMVAPTEPAGSVETFEQLCRQHDIEGTAMARLAEVFYQAGMAAMAAPVDPWHDAVLNACMVVEGCYVAADPAKTLASLIDWYVMNERASIADVVAPKTISEALDAAYAASIPIYTEETAPHPNDIGRPNLGAFDFDKFKQVLTASSLPAERRYEGDPAQHIRFDFINADGREDSKVITHDEMRQRYADLRQTAIASIAPNDAQQSALKDIEEIQQFLSDNAPARVMLHARAAAVERYIRATTAAAPPAPEWHHIETAPKDGSLMLLAAEFDRPGDWRIKIGGYWDNTWNVFGASWTPTRWMRMPPFPDSQ